MRQSQNFLRKWNNSLILSLIVSVWLVIYTGFPGCNGQAHHRNTDATMSVMDSGKISTEQVLSKSNPQSDSLKIPPGCRCHLVEGARSTSELIVAQAAIDWLAVNRSVFDVRLRITPRDDSFIVNVVYLSRSSGTQEYTTRPGGHTMLTVSPEGLVLDVMKGS